MVHLLFEHDTDEVTNGGTGTNIEGEVVNLEPCIVGGLEKANFV